MKRVLMFVLTMLLSLPTWATPFTWGDRIIEPLRWPAASTINVWVQNIDTAGLNSRQQLFADGISRWAAELDRGYTINVNVGDPPAGTTNLVRFTWAAPGTTFRGFTLDGNQGAAGPNPNATNTAIASAEGVISNTLPATTAAQREFVRNLGMHEFTHALGLADDAAGTVTNHLVRNDGAAMTFNERDRTEITTLYLRPAGGGPRGQATRQNAGGGTGTYIYDYNFEGLASEHIPLITLGIDPKLVTSVDVPTGWLFLNPNSSSTHDPNAPFYQDYMVDGTPVPEPWSIIEPLDYLAFRSISPLFDLTTLNQLLTFTVHASGDRVGTINTWAGLSDQQLEGPIPEPATIALLGAGLIPLVVARKRKCRTNVSCSKRMVA